MADLGGGAPPPSDQIFLDFMQFSGKFNKNVSRRPPPPWGLAPPPRKILDPPLLPDAIGYRSSLFFFHVGTTFVTIKTNWALGLYSKDRSKRLCLTLADFNYLSTLRFRTGPSWIGCLRFMKKKHLPRTAYADVILRW